MAEHQKQQDFSNEEIITNRQGHAIADNQNVRTVGDRGPTVLENYNFLEKTRILIANAFQNG